VGCVAGQPCATQQQGGNSQLSPAQQEAQQLAAKERERNDNARFSSNLAYSRPAEQPQSQSGRVAQSSANSYALAANDSSMVNPRAVGEPPAQPKRSPEVNIDSAVGQPYVIYEGLTMDTVLMNRLDGDAVGPVKVLVSNPVYSHDHQHVLIPDGTIVLGEAKKIGAAGFGQQRRMAVAFHRMIMPDGYSVDLDQFHGLDQIGEEGLKDKVNNHYLEIFGTSIALGVIAGAGEIEQGGGTITTSGSQAFTTGAASSVSQSATSILDRFMQIPPTITIREGHRVKVYFTQDMLLPAYTNHAIPQTF
jgi:type IV secretion system protein VirB10